MSGLELASSLRTTTSAHVARGAKILIALGHVNPRDRPLMLNDLPPVIEIGNHQREETLVKQFDDSMMPFSARNGLNQLIWSKGLAAWTTVWTAPNVTGETIFSGSWGGTYFVFSVRVGPSPWATHTVLSWCQLHPRDKILLPGMSPLLDLPLQTATRNVALFRYGDRARVANSADLISGSLAPRLYEIPENTEPGFYSIRATYAEKQPWLTPWFHVLQIGLKCADESACTCFWGLSCVDSGFAWRSIPELVTPEPLCPIDPEPIPQVPDPGSSMLPIDGFKAALSFPPSDRRHQMMAIITEEPFAFQNRGCAADGSCAPSAIAAFKLTPQDKYSLSTMWPTFEHYSLECTSWDAAIECAIDDAGLMQCLLPTLRDVVTPGPCTIAGWTRNAIDTTSTPFFIFANPLALPGIASAGPPTTHWSEIAHIAFVVINPTASMLAGSSFPYPRAGWFSIKLNMAVEGKPVTRSADAKWTQSCTGIGQDHPSFQHGSGGVQLLCVVDYRPRPVGTPFDLHTVAYLFECNTYPAASAALQDVLNVAPWVAAVWPIATPAISESNPATRFNPHATSEQNLVQPQLYRGQAASVRWTDGLADEEIFMDDRTIKRLAPNRTGSVFEKTIQVTLKGLTAEIEYPVCSKGIWDDTSGFYACGFQVQCGWKTGLYRLTAEYSFPVGTNGTVVRRTTDFGVPLEIATHATGEELCHGGSRPEGHTALFTSVQAFLPPQADFHFD
ncbi:hypothetical protein HDU89_008931 [Geranomyces variabilis]|nr:hypothetical protein HDU89_008931 [Geranomyces variabilis]